MKKEYKIIIWIALTIAIFLIGYYLRAYLPLHQDLPYSPYEAFTSSYKQKLLNAGPVVDYTDKAMRYPTSYLLRKLLNPIFGNLYILYALGAIIVFFLGKEITNRSLGGFWAFSIYALAPENLLQYVRDINTKGSGICYVLIWVSLLFFIKYLKSKKWHNLTIFIILSLLTVTSYHTGATAMIILLIGLLISLIYSAKLNKKILISIIGITIFYIFWIKLFDPVQLTLIINSYRAIGLTVTISFLFFLTCLYFIRNSRFLQSEYLPLIILIPSAILIFAKYHFFQGLLSLGVKNYYSSAITLNNYMAQALLTHVYLLLLLPILFKKELKPEYLVLRGWLIGLILISGGLISQHYYARIFDYSFPLMFVLFGLYWVRSTRFRFLIITTTATLLIISQLMIYNDPFTMRRYYKQNEIDSVQKIIALNLNGTIASDLRTSALFSYLGKKDIQFGRSGYELHDSIFYEYGDISNLKINYVILSESMRTILYSTNFETRPVADDFFKYYKYNFKAIYNDGLMHVYEIK